ncbi:MAG: hypothetical protein HYT11_04815 [Candidatus Levybacteria bacterium]|nr:hypothetical protein [Candidatus Levybacteria bacterium]
MRKSSRKHQTGIAKIFIPIIILIVIVGLVFFFWPGYPPNQFLQSLIAGKPFTQQIAQINTGDKIETHEMPKFLNIEFKPGVDQSDEVEMRKGFTIMDFYLNQWFGHSITKKSAVVVEVSDKDSKFQETNGTIEFIYRTLSQDWQQPKQVGAQYKMDMRSRAAAHEYVHLYQINQGCANVGREGEKVKWFLEGEAEWLSYKSMEKSGNLPYSFDANKMIMMQFMMGGGNFSQLSSYERAKAVNIDPSLYGYFAMAVEYLIKDRDIKSLDGFCASLGKGQELSAAFENAFGIPLQKFYSEFEAYRQNL